MHRFGCGGVTRALMRDKRGHLCVQMELSAKEGSVSVLRDMADPTATDLYALRIVELQREEGPVI